jgi:hypothetical protein
MKMSLPENSMSRDQTNGRISMQQRFEGHERIMVRTDISL